MGDAETLNIDIAECSDFPISNRCFVPLVHFNQWFHRFPSLLIGKTSK